jgi:hypothetical protein
VALADGLAESPQQTRLRLVLVAGWRVVSVSAADLHRPELLLARLRAELG